MSIILLLLLCLPAPSQNLSYELVLVALFQGGPSYIYILKFNRHFCRHLEDSPEQHRIGQVWWNQAV